MAKKITDAELEEFEAMGIKAKPKQALKSRVAPENSEQMNAAILAMEKTTEAVIKAVDKSNELVDKVTSSNKILMTKMLEISNAGQVTKLKINRNKDKLMTDIELIRT